MSSIDIYSAIPTIQSKTCPKCNITKSLELFSKDKRNKLGYQTNCKLCVREYQKENKELKKVYDKEYRESNKTEIKYYQKYYNKIYNKTNKAEHAARSAK